VLTAWTRFTNRILVDGENGIIAGHAKDTGHPEARPRRVPDDRSFLVPAMHRSIILPVSPLSLWKYNWKSFAELFDNGGDPMATKHLLTGVAVVAALAFSAPVLAQQASPGGNPMGMPGPSPGGPGLTPYSTGAPPPAPTPSGRMPAGGRATSGERIPPIMPAPPPSASDTASATPPTQSHARAHHATHGTMAHGTMAHGPKSVTDTAAQLNQAELARLPSRSECGDR
jgi:hypothetical protein